MNVAKDVLRLMAALVAGYALMVVLITLVQETWLGGVSYRESSWGVLAVAGFFTFLSAVAGGIVAAWLARRHERLLALVISVLVATETTFLVTAGRTRDPLWFDMVAATSLVVGVWLGVLLIHAKRWARSAGSGA